MPRKQQNKASKLATFLKQSKLFNLRQQVHSINAIMCNYFTPQSII